MGRVLIADGDREMQDLLAHALSQADCQVELVARGEEVLEEIAKGGIDAVVTEVHLTDMPAWRLIPKVHQVDPYMPIIAITADDSWETSRRVRVEGGPVFFFGLKPLDLREMQKVVTSAVCWRGKQRSAGKKRRQA
jgi:two-component system, NtrC family, nitrogen regulation response regulator GlnG